MRAAQHRPRAPRIRSGGSRRRIPASARSESRSWRRSAAASTTQPSPACQQRGGERIQACCRCAASSRAALSAEALGCPAGGGRQRGALQARSSERTRTRPAPCSSSSATVPLPEPDRPTVSSSSGRGRRKLVQFGEPRRSVAPAPPRRGAAPLPARAPGRGRSAKKGSRANPVGRRRVRHRRWRSAGERAQAVAP